MAQNEKKFIDAQALTSAEFAELRKASSDIFFFSTFVKVVHPLLGKVPFELYPYQIATLLCFLEYRFNIILKFRQAGVTELISMYCLWYAMYHPHKNIVIISIKDRVAKKVLRKIKFMYRNLPAHLKTKIVNGKNEQSLGTASEMEFANGSIIASIPTTEEAGRSEAVSLLVIDEAAIVRWADKIWAASFPTLSTGGRAIVNSTAYGVGNFFHRTFQAAVAGGNVFHPIRLHWQMHPERDWNWYKEQAEILGPRKTAQEIDGDFLTSGNTVFDLSDIRDIDDYLDTIQPIKTELNGLLHVFEKPKRDLKYTLGADVATGRGYDYSAFSLMDQHGDEKVCMKARIPLDKFEKIVAKYGKEYRARVAPESNDIGLGLAMNLQNNGYTNLYYSRKMLKKKGKSRPEVEEIPGWYTTKKNRPLIIAELEEDIRNDTCNIKNRFFTAEAPTFIYDARNRPIAMNKDKTAEDDIFNDEVYTDDSTFAEAITNWVRKEPLNKNNVLPR
jgi:hypothetical protein